MKNHTKCRQPEEDIDISLFDEMEDQEVIGYVEGKYSKEVAEEVMDLVDKIISKE